MLLRSKRDTTIVPSSQAGNDESEGGANITKGTKQKRKRNLDKGTKRERKEEVAKGKKRKGEPNIDEDTAPAPKTGTKDVVKKSQTTTTDGGTKHTLNETSCALVASHTVESTTKNSRNVDPELTDIAADPGAAREAENLVSEGTSKTSSEVISTTEVPRTDSDATKPGFRASLEDTRPRSEGPLATQSPSTVNGPKGEPKEVATVPTRTAADSVALPCTDIDHVDRKRSEGSSTVEAPSSNLSEPVPRTRVEAIGTERELSETSSTVKAPQADTKTAVSSPRYPTKMDPHSPPTANLLRSNVEKLKVKPPGKPKNSIRNLDPSIIAKDAASTRIIVHHRFPDLVKSFLAFKREKGSSYEKALYGSADGFTWKDEVARLIEKRPLVFLGCGDTTLLRNGTRPPYDADMNTEWDRNGTEEQHRNSYLSLEEYLSYDEMLLSSLIGVSGPSYFINDGNRYNQGARGQPGSFEQRGIIIGLVGARFEREERMEAIFIRPSDDSMVYQHPELTKIFEKFFSPSDSSVVVDRDAGLNVFNVAMFKARIGITIRMLLEEANSRASADKKAYVYVVGHGLGVWAIDDRQPQFYIEAFIEALESDFPDIGTIEFAWIDDVLDQVKQDVTAAAARQNIKVIFSHRNPAEKLDTDELLVLSYAWDGNAFPGNEYWHGSLAGSGDPAAACMSTIAELHNPLVNPFTDRIWLAGVGPA